MFRDLARAFGRARATFTRIITRRAHEALHRQRQALLGRRCSVGVVALVGPFAPSTSIYFDGNPNRVLLAALVACPPGDAGVGDMNRFFHDIPSFTNLLNGDEMASWRSKEKVIYNTTAFPWPTFLCVNFCAHSRASIPPRTPPFFSHTPPGIACCFSLRVWCGMRNTHPPPVIACCFSLRVWCGMRNTENENTQRRTGAVPQHWGCTPGRCQNITVCDTDVLGRYA